MLLTAHLVAVTSVVPPPLLFHQMTWLVLFELRTTNGGSAGLGLPNVLEACRCYSNRVLLPLLLMKCISFSNLTSGLLPGWVLESASHLHFSYTYTSIAHRSAKRDELLVSNSQLVVVIYTS